MMPMVFSATASSMPALVASRPISSSIVPRPSADLRAGSFLARYLDRAREELQAMTSFGVAIQAQSRSKCCSNARAGAEFG
jgi:Lon protease-like protein